MFAYVIDMTWKIDTSIESHFIFMFADLISPFYSRILVWYESISKKPIGGNDQI